MDAKMLDGKVAIITGASYGMGRTMAELFAEEGASVVITARGKEKLDEVVKAINDRGGRAVGVVADTCSTEDTKRVFETTLREFGDLDILINNAGIGEQKLIDETDDEWMLYVMNTNLGGPMRYIREALKIFLPKNDGVIINISSVNGTRPFCGATYTSTKGALNTLTKNVAMRLIDTNIRCNAVAPGATITPAHLANKAGEQPGGAQIQRTLRLLPRPRVRGDRPGLRLPLPRKQNGPGSARAGAPGLQRSVSLRMTKARTSPLFHAAATRRGRAPADAPSSYILSLCAFQSSSLGQAISNIASMVRCRSRALSLAARV